MLVVRELMFAPKRFQMIRAGIPGVTASVLTGRLAQLTQTGVVDHDERLSMYALTDAGRDLLPVLEALCRWALVVPGHDRSRFISPSALMISMGVNLVPDLAQGRSTRAGFRCGGEAFEMRLTEGRLRTDAVGDPDAPFVLVGTGNTLAAAVYVRTPLPTLVSKGPLKVEGDIVAAERFLSLFRLERQP